MADVEKIGLMGHSLGGAASVSVGRYRDDVDAVIDLDGTMLGEQLGFEYGKYQYEEEPYPVPLFAPPLAAALGTGTVDATECIEAVNAMVLEYMNYYLMGSGE